MATIFEWALEKLLQRNLILTEKDLTNIEHLKALDDLNKAFIKDNFKQLKEELRKVGEEINGITDRSS